MGKAQRAHQDGVWQCYCCGGLLAVNHEEHRGHEEKQNQNVETLCPITLR
jgi:hypothetical protein